MPSHSLLLTASGVALLLLQKLRTAHAYPTEDLVENLPGWGKPPSDWYSGYLTYRLPCLGDQLIHTHYVYIEAEQESGADGGDATVDTSASRQIAATDSPLIFWSNGGPGASSLFGLLTELGPFLLNDDSIETDSYKKTGVPSLLPNPSSWNKLGSLLIFDAPAPVGFSYCDDNPEGDGLSCGGWNDESSASNNYHALIAFYDKFPELQTRPLFLTGESYAGIYIPSMARRILEHNLDTKYDSTADRSDASSKIPLRGFAVGDACAGADINCGVEALAFQLMFFGGHGQISLKLMNEVRAVCSMDELHTPGASLSPKCSAKVKKALDAAGGFYEYSLYDDCTYHNGLLRRRPIFSPARRAGTEIGAKGALNDYVCGGGEVMEEYVRHSLVRQALHVPPESNFFDGDNGVGFNYTVSERNLMPFYIDVAKGKYVSEGVRTLVYNGDTDPSINSFAAQNWTSRLGLQEVEEWRPWTLDSCRRMGGYVTRYEGSFDFLTIRGAGHMVPTYKPEAAFAFMKAWIQGNQYPKFVPSCEHP